MHKVLFATSEAQPFAQTGGLGDVCGSLPHALAKLGCEVRLVMPAYSSIPPAADDDRSHSLQVQGREQPVTVVRRRLAPGLEIWFLDFPDYFAREGGLYGDAHGNDWPDNPHRFAFFCRAVAALATGGAPEGWRPDVVHCHDWQTALVPALLAGVPDRPALVFTIHNLAYQGLCSHTQFSTLGLPAYLWHHDRLEFHGQCSFIKGGIVYADVVTTVSPTYAEEITRPEYGCGLDGLLRTRTSSLIGIMNGIDYALWNPETDPHLAVRYNLASLADKAENKRILQQAFGLPQEREAFLLGMVSRLAEQKGVDLVLAALEALRGHPVQCVILGSGDPWLVASVGRVAEEEPHRVGARFGYDTALSHRVIAGADAFLMPSRFEPCGLSQLYSQRYGTIPIARRTGGLLDSVVDRHDDVDRATGFLFDEASGAALVTAIDRAYNAYRQSAVWSRLQRNGMVLDFSWERSAHAYIAVYQRANAAARG